MALYAIGDVHGCAQTLRRLIGQIDPGQEDHLVFIGDYIDRGPDSYGVVEYLLGLSGQCRCTFLRGNHEAMLLTYLADPDYTLWQTNGGTETLESYARAGFDEIPETHLEFFRATKLCHDAKDFFFVHAGLKAHLTIQENLERFGPEVFLWERSHLNTFKHAWEKPVVCGHTPQRSPIDQPKLLSIDTGCVYHMYPGFGDLTAVELPTRRFLHEHFSE